MTISSKDKDWRPWIMPAMSAPQTQASPLHNNPSPKRPSAETLRHALEEIQQARERARTQGHAEGYQAGHQEGLQQGQEQGFQKGYEEGLQKGLQEGLQQAQEQTQQQHKQFTTRLHTLLEQAHNSLHHLDESLGEALVSLCCSLAEHILHREIQAHNYDLLPIINRALRHLTDEHPITIHVHPEDYALLTQNEDWPTHWALLPDSQLSPCSIQIQAPWGEVDAQLHTRWQALLHSLFPDFPQSSPQRTLGLHTKDENKVGSTS